MGITNNKYGYFKLHMPKRMKIKLDNLKKDINEPYWSIIDKLIIENRRLKENDRIYSAFMERIRETEKS